MKPTTSYAPALTSLTKSSPQTVYGLIDRLQLTDYADKAFHTEKQETATSLSLLELYFTSIMSGASALAFHSVDAALTLLVTHLLKEGEHAVSFNSTSFYRKQHTHWGHLDVTIVQPSRADIAALKTLVNEKTKFIYLETINEEHHIPDFQKVIAFAHEQGIPVIVDNSAIGPYGFNPLKEKADLVLYRTRHWLAPETGAASAVLIEGHSFPWFSGKYPSLPGTPKSKVLLDFLRKKTPVINYTERQQEQLTHALLNLKTSVLNKYDTTWEVARWLQQNKWIERLQYVGAVQHTSHFTALTYFENGYGNYLSFTLNGFEKEYTDFKKLVYSKYFHAPLVEFTFNDSTKSIGLSICFGTQNSILDFLHRLFDEFRPTGYARLF